MQILTSRPEIALTIASNDLSSAQLLAKSSEAITVLPLDVSDTTSVSRLIAEADVVISFVFPLFSIFDLRKITDDSTSVDCFQLLFTWG